jgi:O-antigen ligase
MAAESRPRRRPPLTRIERTVAAVVMVGAVLIPLVVDLNLIDTFRLPKELAFRAEALALFALGVFWLAARRRRWTIEWRRPDYAVAALVLIWSGIAVLTSTNRRLSVESLITIVAAVLIYLATTVVAQTAGIAAIDWLALAAGVNALMAVLQEARIWNPFRFPADVVGHVRTTALIGNANDVGTFLVTPLIAALVMVAVSRGRRRWSYVAVMLLLIAGLIASSTRTAVAAFAAGAVAFAVFRSWRSIVVVALALAIIAAAAISSSTTLGRSVRFLWHGVQERRYDVVFSERLPLFLSAIDMMRDHPVTGVGPGCYAYHDIGYRLRLSTHYPEAWTTGWRQKAGQAHNDHLQVAAETGIPGYALLLAAMVVTAIAPWRVRRAEGESIEKRFASAFLPPFAVSVFVVMLAQFPLEIAAPRLMILTLGALGLTWIRRDEQE